MAETTPTRPVILVVHDQDEVRTVLRVLLECEGFGVLEAATGEKALATMVAKPDLVLLETHLPDLSGFEVCKRLRQQGEYTTLPIVHLTSREFSSADQAMGLVGGADAYLTIPVDLQVLVATVRAFLRARDAEKALRESQRSLSTLMANLPGMAYRCDIDPDWTMLFVSEGCTALTGYPPEALLGNRSISYMEVIHHLDREMVWREVEEGLAERGSFVMEYRIVTAAGEEKWVWEQGRRVIAGGADRPTIEGLVVDVTERKRAEAEHREAEIAASRSDTRFRELFEASRDGIVLSDNDGRILECNRAFLGILGAESEEDVRHIALRDITPAEYHQMEHRIIYEQIVPFGYCDAYEKEYIRKDGSRVPVSLRAWVRHDSSGHTIGAWALVRDISEQKDVEQQLRRAQRLETAGRIAGQVAHDFNNLLGPLAAYPELIKLKLPPESVLHSYCDAMLTAAQQMADINEDMMALARRGHFNERSVSLNDLIGRILDEFPPLPSEVRLEFNPGPDLLPLVGSASQLSRVITNLLNNAVDAVHRFGIVSIATENVYVDRPLQRYNRVEPGEYVAVIVRDTGNGISPEIQDKIFDAFFTTKSDSGRKGCGLGLSVVQAIVDDHQGYVDLESTPGEGTTFTVYLPVSREAAEKTEVSMPAPGTGQTVLVVDDDEGQREVARQMLGTLGYAVETVSSGEEAISYLNTRAVDLVLLDMVMPAGINGLETYRRIRAIRPGQKAIVFSGFAPTAEMDEIRALGVGSYLRKPLTMNRLAAALQEVLK